MSYLYGCFLVRWTNTLRATQSPSLERRGKEERKVQKQKRSVAEKSRINSSKEDGNIALADVFPRVELLPRKSNLRWKITR